MTTSTKNRSLLYFCSFAFLAIVFLHLIFRGSDPNLASFMPSKMAAHAQQPYDIKRRLAASRLDLPSVDGARAALLSFHSFTESESAEPVELAMYEDAAHGTSSVKRVVIQIHGQGRDAWNAWSNAANARSQVARQSSHFSVKDVLVVAPVFFNGLDKHMYRWSGKGSTGQLLVWKGNVWGEGGANQYPHRETDVSSFEALDAMLLYYSDRDNFPHVDSIVVSGHSLGGQFVHRYATLSNLPLSSPVKLSFIISNPSTLLYLDTDRPRHKDSDDSDDHKKKNKHHHHAEGFNEYKYGLERVQFHLGEYYRRVVAHGGGGRALWHRFVREREVHYVNGAADRGVGDERPAAFAQGKDRVDRFKNYIVWASTDDRGDAWPRAHTVDWVHGVAHDERAILASEPGRKWMFLD
ncbi:hypothetical protein V8E36_009918 [Tilletia maclaganii]